MPYIIGTAGHIDHGKTSLIKALTGQDTDRLKEEKERGISIDLGFAHLDLPDGTRRASSTCPGTSGSSRTCSPAPMASTSSSSPSPPTTASCRRPKSISTSSICSASRWRSSSSPKPIWRPPRIAEVEEEIDILTLGTVLENSPKIAVSSVTGQGIDELKS